jgi:hypothetical protein
MMFSPCLPLEVVAADRSLTARQGWLKIATVWRCPQYCRAHRLSAISHDDRFGPGWTGRRPRVQWTDLARFDLIFTLNPNGRPPNGRPFALVY